MDNNPVDSIELRKGFEDRLPDYKRLVSAVNLIISSAIEKKRMKIHSIKHRIKSYPSFMEKARRKQYKAPFTDCTDIAGCRVLCLFLSQVSGIKRIIEEEFEVVEITDKKTTKKLDQFGYVSLHILVKIPRHRLSFSLVESAEGSTIMPPLLPPNGISATAHFQVIQVARARTMSMVSAW